MVTPAITVAIAFSTSAVARHLGSRVRRTSVSAPLMIAAALSQLLFSGTPVSLPQDDRAP